VASVSDIDTEKAIGESWEISVGFAGEGGGAVDGSRGLVVDDGAKGGSITVRGVRKIGENVDRADL